MMNKTSFIKSILALAIFVGGLSVFLYPAVSNFVNEQFQTEVIYDFEKAVAEMSSGDKATALESAHSYNASLVQNQGTLHDPFGDQSQKEPEENVVSFLTVGEVMGYVQIPKIDIKAPVYEGVSEDVLQRAIGWLPGTSLPVGGESTNSVLSGHRGLPTAKLFTDLDLLEPEDEFFFINSDEILAYKVVEKKIVDPRDSDALEILPGQDRMTLLTCHPYMINSHRLLVIGERIPYVGQLDEIEENTNWIDSMTGAEKDLFKSILIVAGLLVVVILIFWLSRYRRKKQKGHKNV